MPESRRPSFRVTATCEEHALPGTIIRILYNEPFTQSLLNAIVFFKFHENPFSFLEMHPRGIRYLIIFTARGSYASAVLGVVILSVRPSVCPSVTRVLCD